MITWNRVSLRIEKNSAEYIINTK